MAAERLMLEFRGGTVILEIGLARREEEGPNAPAREAAVVVVQAKGNKPRWGLLKGHGKKKASVFVWADDDRDTVALVRGVMRAGGGGGGGYALADRLEEQTRNRTFRQESWRAIVKLIRRV